MLWVMLCLNVNKRPLCRTGLQDFKRKFKPASKNQTFRPTWGHKHFNLGNIVIYVQRTRPQRAREWWHFLLHSVRSLLSESYRLWASHHGCWCGCWPRSSGFHSGHFGWSLQEWQADELGESEQWENYAGPTGTYGHRWSGFLQKDKDQLAVTILLLNKYLMRLLSNLLRTIKVSQPTSSTTRCQEMLLSKTLIHSSPTSLSPSNFKPILGLQLI